jgi:hypothetical protein
MWASIANYFWLPCPLCRRYSGGHEWNGVSIPVSLSRGKGVCPRKECQEEAKRLTKEYHRNYRESIEILERGW